MYLTEDGYYRIEASCGYSAIAGVSAISGVRGVAVLVDGAYATITNSPPSAGWATYIHSGTTISAASGAVLVLQTAHSHKAITTWTTALGGKAGSPTIEVIRSGYK